MRSHWQVLENRKVIMIYSYGESIFGISPCMLKLKNARYLLWFFGNLPFKIIGKVSGNIDLELFH